MPLERRRVSKLWSGARFARRSKVGRGLIAFLLGLILGAGASGLIFNLTAPRPEMDVKISRGITLFAEGQSNGRNFQVPDPTGSAISRPQFNNAVLTYREIRLGGGIRLKLLPFAAVQTEAGEALGRDSQPRVGSLAQRLEGSRF